MINHIHKVVGNNTLECEKNIFSGLTGQHCTVLIVNITTFISSSLEFYFLVGKIMRGTLIYFEKYLFYECICVLLTYLFFSFLRVGVIMVYTCNLRFCGFLMYYCNLNLFFSNCLINKHVLYGQYDANIVLTGKKCNTLALTKYII